MKLTQYVVMKLFDLLSATAWYISSKIVYQLLNCVKSCAGKGCLQMIIFYSAGQLHNVSPSQGNSV